MTNLAYIEHYTRDDFYQWEGDWELIYGQPYAMAPSPVYGHQFVSGKIYRQLDEKLEKCIYCNASFEIDIEFSEDTILRPDCIVICYEPTERLTKAPEIVFEVVSKSSARKDETIKFEVYQDEGVKYYILVYPDIKKAKVYRLDLGRFIKEGDFSDEVYTFELDSCKIEFDFNFIWRKNK